MMRTLFARWFAPDSIRPRKRRTAGRPAQRSRWRVPRLEWLEDRTAPATWVVDPTPGVGNFTTIGAAVSSPMVVNGDTINVDPGTYTEQLVNATAISKSLTLTGAGAGNSIIQCPATLVPDLTLPNQPSTLTRPLIEMNNGAQVTMSGFTVTGPGPSQ